MAAPANGPLAVAAIGVEARLAGVEAGIVQLQAGQAQLQAGQAQLQAGQAQLQAQITQLQAGQAQLQAGQAQLQAAVQGIAAQMLALGGGDEHQRRALARRANSALSDEPFVVVPAPGGAAPVSWPPAFNRAALRTLLAAGVDALLAEFTVPAAAGELDARRKLLAEHIGAVY